MIRAIPRSPGQAVFGAAARGSQAPTGPALTPMAVSFGTVTYVLTVAEQIVTPELRESAGFDPSIRMHENAPALNRLVAFTGRTA
jgi:hypothetical protein